jgi:hypothetical protein
MLLGAFRPQTTPEDKKVTGSQDDGFVGVLKNILVGCAKNKNYQKSHNLSGC